MGECADAVCLWEALSSSEPWISGWKKPHVFPSLGTEAAALSSVLNRLMCLTGSVIA